MDILTSLKISGSGLKAERARLNVAAMNLANVDTTRTIEGGPYRAKSVVFSAKPLDNFKETLDSAAARLRKVQDSIIHLRPYVNKLNEIITNISQSIDIYGDNPYAEEREINKILIIVLRYD